MLTPQQIKKEIDALERQGMPRPMAEKKFWDTYRLAQRYVENDNLPSFGLMLENFLHPKVADGMVGCVGYITED